MRRTGRSGRYVTSIGLGLVTVLWMAACHDHGQTLVGPPPVDAELRPIVSDPLVGLVAPASRASAAPTYASGSGIAYVSLPPGSMAGGTVGEIRNQRTGVRVQVALSAGGFDPTPIAAAVTDTLVVNVSEESGREPLVLRVVVPAARRPVVVRTDPPPRRRDVPLNAHVVIVFSEPMDLSALSAGAIALFQGETPVAGDLRFLDDRHLAVVVTPAAPLKPGTDYGLVVGTSARDLDGDTLAQGVSIQFTTATSQPAVASLRLVPDTLVIAQPYLARAMGVYLWDPAGHEIGYGPWITAQVTGDPIVDVWSGFNYENFGRNVFYVTPRGPVGSARVSVAFGGTTQTSVILVDSVTLTAASIGMNWMQCHLASTGIVFCRGPNERGQLGIDIATNGGEALVAALHGVRFKAVSVGYEHVCALSLAGDAWCWGSDSWGTSSGGLGSGGTLAPCNPDAVQGCSPTPLLVAGGHKYTAISAGMRHTCALTLSGAAYCWGWNRDGELGNGSRADAAAPVAVGGGLSFVQISVGPSQSCALTAAGAAYCWGWNWVSGSDTSTDRLLPTAVAGGLTFRSIAAGKLGAHACAVAIDGDAYCWGSNATGELGDGSNTDSPVPVRIPLPSGVKLTQIDATFYMNCGVASGGAVWCWGTDPVTDEPVAPTRVAATVPFVSVTASLQVSCGVTAEPAVYCWTGFSGPAWRLEGQR